MLVAKSQTFGNQVSNMNLWFLQIQSELGWISGADVCYRMRSLIYQEMDYSVGMK
jgi:hypothetical protein